VDSKAEHWIGQDSCPVKTPFVYFSQEILVSSSYTRRDFLSATSLAALGVHGALQPRIALGAIDPAARAPKGATITRLGIYPPIGICRVGNSDEVFLAPEIPGLSPEPEGGFKDGQRKIKKQAQRFRVYGFDEQGRVVREVTSTTDQITWHVKLANTKAGWFDFNNPLDMGDLAPGIPGERRNDSWIGASRADLEITPDAVHIRGANTNIHGSERRYRMDGTFWVEPARVPVSLGNVRTDGKGRLIVVPGSGRSASAPNQNPIKNFADNDGWHDDWADGWVRAEVTLADGSTLPVDPAWVACCGPNFAPGIDTFITMYDVIRDVMIHAKKPSLVSAPKGPLSFREEIYPFLRRLGQMEWTSAAANLREGWIDVGAFLDEAYIQKLADPSASNKALRQDVLAAFRSPDDYHLYTDGEAFAKERQQKIPYMLGSGVNFPFSPAHWFVMPKLQYDLLQQWADGDFINDLADETVAESSHSFDDLPLSQQPHALTRAALDPLSGGAFHPGVELTWPLRQQALFSNTDPFRLEQGNRGPMWEQVEHLGLQLNTGNVFGPGEPKPEHLSGESYSFYDLPEHSPIGPQNPGDLTRWLGLPWQADAFSCQNVLFGNDFPNATWWPANLPISVLPEYAFEQLSRDDLSDQAKLKFFNTRVMWSRDVAGVGYHASGSYMDGLKRMIALWGHMGFIESRPRPKGLSPTLQKLIPAELFVETGRAAMDMLSNPDSSK
jgi:hypothetical protein